MPKSISSDQVVGVYQMEGSFGYKVASIHLKADQTFEYTKNLRLAMITSYGTWEIHHGKIILNSEFQPSEKQKKAFEIIKTDSENSDSLFIKVFDSEGKALHMAACWLKDNETILVGGATNEQGEITLLRPVTADSLIISYIGFRSVRQDLDSSTTSYVFKMKKGLKYYKYFTNQVLNYKDGRLYGPSIKKSKYLKKNYFQRVN